MCKCTFFKLQDNGLFYDGNKGCYYYFDVIAQKYRLHSQIHSDTVQSNEPDIQNDKNCQDIPESISGDSDSDNSEDSGNLVIKEDTEEDTEQSEKEINDTALNPIEKLPVKCQEEKNRMIQESNMENIDTKNEKEEIKSEDCPPPSSTCEVFILFN